MSRCACGGTGSSSNVTMTPCNVAPALRLGTSRTTQHPQRRFMGRWVYVGASEQAEQLLLSCPVGWGWDSSVEEGRPAQLVADGGGLDLRGAGGGPGAHARVMLGLSTLTPNVLASEGDAGRKNDCRRCDMTDREKLLTALLRKSDRRAHAEISVLDGHARQAGCRISARRVPQGGPHCRVTLRCDPCQLGRTTRLMGLGR